MAKIGIFKKVAALATAIAIVVCFAVTAGAVVEVTTMTSYVDGAEGDILVEVTIAGDFVDKSVSYYAYNDEGSPVYIDQFEDVTDEIVFDFVTESANLDSDVKIGYTGADAAEDAKVDGNTVTWGDAVAYIPTEAKVATVTFETEATDVLSSSAENATITSIVPNSGKSLTVMLSDIKGAVTLDIQFKAQATAQIIDAAFVVSNGSDDIKITDENREVVDTEWRKHVKLTAIGKVTGATEYGVIVCEKDATYTADDKFQAAGITKSGHFAVQLIDDNSDDATFINRNKQYDVRAYADATDSEKVTVSCVDLTATNN